MVSSLFSPRPSRSLLVSLALAFAAFGLSDFRVLVFQSSFLRYSVFAIIFQKDAAVVDNFCGHSCQKFEFNAPSIRNEVILHQIEVTSATLNFNFDCFVCGSQEPLTSECQVRRDVEKKW